MTYMLAGIVQYRDTFLQCQLKCVIKKQVRMLWILHDPPLLFENNMSDILALQLNTKAFIHHCVTILSRLLNKFNNLVGKKIILQLEKILVRYKITQNLKSCYLLFLVYQTVWGHLKTNLFVFIVCLDSNAWHIYGQIPFIYDLYHERCRNIYLQW